MTENEMRVSSIMRSPVVMIHAEAGLDRAMLMMRTQRIRHLPVVDDDQHLVGIVTDRDLRLSMLEMEGDHGETSKGFYLPAMTKVRSVMIGNVLTVQPETPVADAVSLMSGFKIGALPVLEPGSKKIVGIVTETDLLRLLTKLLKKT